MTKIEVEGELTLRRNETEGVQEQTEYCLLIGPDCTGVKLATPTEVGRDEIEDQVDSVRNLIFLTNVRPNHQS